MIFLTILKYVFLTFAIRYTFSNFGRLFSGQGVKSATMWIMSIGISGYLLFQFGLGV